MTFNNDDDYRQYLKDRYAEVRAQYREYLGGRCALCGSVEGLEFDHIDWRTKSFAIMTKWSQADKDQVYAELDKCQLLCGPHHKVKSAQDMSEMTYYRPMKHGNMYTWQKLKCQCDTCLTAKQIWYDERNARRRR